MGASTWSTPRGFSMLLKVLVMIAFAVWPLLFPSAAKADDLSLPLIRENGEVIGCYDEPSFARLSVGDPISDLVPLCTAYRLQDGDVPTFIGYAFLNPPAYAEANPDDEFVVARKYTMETAKGTFRFVWPYALDPSDYALFWSEEELFQPTPEELAEYGVNPEAADELPEIKASAVFL